MFKILPIFALVSVLGSAGCGGGNVSDNDQNDPGPTNTGEIDPPVNPESLGESTGAVPTGLDALIGTLGFNYGFSDSVDRFERSISFTDDDRTLSRGVQILVNDDNGSFAGCEYGSDLYVCVFIDAFSSEADYFLFSLDQAALVGEGRYERCLNPVNFEQCLADLFINWDGDVSVSINRSNQAFSTTEFSRLLPNGGYVYNADNNPDASHYKAVYKQAMPDLVSKGLTLDSADVPIGRRLSLVRGQ